MPGGKPARSWEASPYLIPELLPRPSRETSYCALIASIVARVPPFLAPALSSAGRYPTLSSGPKDSPTIIRDD